MTTNYEKKLLNEIKELKEGCVPKEILFAERSAHRREIAALKKEVELKKDAWCPELILKDLYENTNYKDPALTIKEYIQKIEAENEKLIGDIDDAVENHFADLKLRETTHKEWDALVEENEELKGEKEYWEKEYHDLKSKVDWGSIEDYSSRIDELITKNNKLYDENKKLKKDIDDALESYMEVFKEE